MPGEVDVRFIALFVLFDRTQRPIYDIWRKSRSR